MHFPSDLRDRLGQRSLRKERSRRASDLFAIVIELPALMLDGNTYNRVNRRGSYADKPPRKTFGSFHPDKSSRFLKTCGLRIVLINETDVMDPDAERTLFV
jgi:hypothetical protein